MFIHSVAAQGSLLNLQYSETMNLFKIEVRSLIDEDGYRPNVGIIVANAQRQVLWARRVGQNAWQFPQGGIKSSEKPEDALYRELDEEIGLAPADVQIVGTTKGWLRYKLPKQMLRSNKSQFVGQKQKWFLLKMLGEDDRVKFDHSTTPEFDHWQWVSYWFPLGQVVQFKQDVYRRAMKELVPHLSKCVPR